MKRWMLLLALPACGSGSGVDGDKRITSLNDDEIHAVCDYLVDVTGGVRTIDCGDARIRFGLDPDECFADTVAFQARYPACAATVDDKEACEQAIAQADEAQICSGDGELPSACDPLFTVECTGR
jgi:hypothetical protein